MSDLFGNEIESYTSKFKRVNPMVLKHGQLQGKRCKDCVYLEYRCHGSKFFTKCTLRGITHGPGTDHLVNWEACNQFRDTEARP